ncbi:MAG: dihydropteroate synthase, partial [Legionella sp.]
MDSPQFYDWLAQKSQFPYSSSKPTLIMGIVNVTSDSFYDGNKYLALDKACSHALQLIADGADIIDIGGESTKPGAVAVPLADELVRVVALIKELRAHSDVCISIDTYKPEVMHAAIEAGANIINDIYALRQKNALTVAAELNVPVCLMHMQGEPRTMQDRPFYPQGVIQDVTDFFAERIDSCLAVGIKPQHLILDPGFGFGKAVSDNLSLMYHLEQFSTFNLPLLLGVSRKSTIGAVLNKEPNQRLIGSITMAAYAALKGVGIIRTHDVDATK